MAEWHVSGPYQQQQHTGVPAQSGGGPEWYSAGGASQYSATSYSYETSRGTQGGAAYGSFEDEAPLLEGGKRP